MNKIGVIGGRDSVLGFRALGLDTCIAENGEQAKAALHRMAKENYAIIYITERRADPHGDRTPARGCFARRHPHPGQGGEPRHRHSGRARGCGKGRRRGHFVKKEQKPYGKDR